AVGGYLWIDAAHRSHPLDQLQRPSIHITVCLPLLCELRCRDPRQHVPWGSSAGTVRMLKTLRPIVSLLLGLAFLLVGAGLQFTLLPLRGRAEGFDDLALGVIGSAYYVGFV